MNLYGRKAVGVDKDGKFILGDWQRIDTSSGIHGGQIGCYKYTISGDYVAFAFSFDIMAGTDYPFSGVFWNDIYNTDWETIEITLDGSCRMADINIKVGDKVVVDVENCSSHKEWKP